MQRTSLPSRDDSVPLAPIPKALESERLIQRILPPFLGGFDLFADKQLVLLWLVNAGAAAGGPVSLLYWFIGGICFYLPTVIATAQLGVVYPGEGALYSWTYRAFALTGRLNISLFLSFFVGACFWIIGPLALVIGANAFVSFLQGVLPATWLVFLVQPWQQGLLMMGLVLLSQVLISQKVSRVQVLLTWTFVANLLAFALILLAGVVWLLSGHSSATNFSDLAGWQPAAPNFGLFGLICLGYLGAPTALTLAGELRPGINRRRAVLSHLFWGGLLVVVCYHLATWALLVVAGPAVLSSAPNLNFTLIQIVAQVLGKPWGIVTAVCLMTFVFISPLMYCLASSRLLLMGSLDQRLPGKLTRINRHHVPALAFWVQTCFALGMLAIIFLVAPLITSLGQPANLATLIYNIVLATLTLIFMLGVLFLFIDLALILRLDPALLAAQQVLPKPILWASLICGIIFCLLVSVDTLWNSFVPLISNANWFLAVGLCFIACSVVLVLFSVLASGEAASQRLTRLYREAEPSASSL